MLKRVKETFHRIVTWQKKPIKVTENVTEEAVCKNCGETYHSNFCPRCGQSRNTPRLGSKNALRIFLDTWGLGYNGLLRTIWHLFARPGYMIGDYIDGRRQLYFPPFKSLFVVGAAFAIIFALAGGFSDEAIEYNNRYSTAFNLGKKLPELWKKDILWKDLEKNAEVEKVEVEVAKQKLRKDAEQLSYYLKKYVDWKDHNKATDQLLTHIIFAVLALYIFKKSPRRPRMNLAENIIAQVYICVQLGVLAIFFMVAALPFTPYPTGEYPGIIAFAFLTYDYKQLFGYGFWRTLWKTFLIYFIHFVVKLLLVIIVVFGIIIHSIAT